MKAMILMTGHTFENLIPLRGDFDTWFRARFAGLIDEWEVIDALTEPDYPKQADVLVITGSPQCVYEFQPWSVKAGEWIKSMIELNVPTLGICYGHQLIAQAMGGMVSKSKNGREMGPCVVEQIGEDLIFKGLNQTFTVWQTHSDEVAVLPSMAKIIAKNQHCDVQAFAIGDHCRTVQWHPEMDLGIMKHYVQQRALILESEWGEGAYERLYQRLVEELPSGLQIIQNFFHYFVAPRKS